MSADIVVVGYFGKQNLGDDVLEYVWNYISKLERFSRYTFTCINIDKLLSYKNLEKSKVLILGGGDVMNEYFMSRLCAGIKQNRFSGYLYAISVGIPYSNVVVEGILDRFNFIMCRAKYDACMLRKRLGNDRIRYFPDLSIYLPKIFYSIVSKQQFKGINDLKIDPLRCNVGVFLTRNICLNNGSYRKVVKGIADALVQIKNLSCESAPNGFEIFLFAFNVDDHTSSHDDRILNNDIYDTMENNEYVHVISDIQSIKDMWYIFKYQLDMSITMRYHSHMYSLLAKVPFMSLHTTKKVSNLLSDTGLLEYSYQLPVDEKFLPTNLDSHTMVSKFKECLMGRDKIVSLCQKYIDTNSIDDFEDTLDTVLQYPPKSNSSVSDKKSKSVMTIKKVIFSLVEYLTNHRYKDPLQPFSTEYLQDLTEKVYTKKLTFKDLVDVQETASELKKLSDFLAALACFNLIHIPFPKYHYGMSKKILNSDFKAKDDFLWVWNDNQNNDDRFFVDYPKLKPSIFNATYVGTEDFKGCHRSGWQYTLDNLMAFHSDSNELIFDNYVDRTFHWAHDVYKYTGLIPFTSSWCGFIHHTFNEEYSPYNVPNLFRNDSFLKSLAHCKALFTLSRDLAIKLQVLLTHYNYKDVKVMNFVHPSDVPKVTFDMYRFTANLQRQIVQVGAWLRDSYGIYRLEPHMPDQNLVTNKKLIAVKKAILKGKLMDAYFKPKDFKLQLVNSGDDSVQDPLTVDTAEDVQKISNKYIKGMMSMLSEQWKSVTTIGTLSNDEYDVMLSENIVFLKLVDASAVNTVIECILRCTPLLVNRHPAVEEMLGKDYPFFYSNMIEAGFKCTDLDTIRDTHKYLVAIDKEQFTIEYFMTALSSYINFLKN